MLYDYLVVGQGLAGSALAYQLIQAGQRVLVIDNQYPHSASRVAAGLFNPITGNEMKKTWWADRLFPYLHQFYRAVEQAVGHRFFFSLPIYRPFESIEQQNHCLAESVEGIYKHYLHTHTATQLYEATVHQPFGGIEVLQAGYIDTAVYLTAIREWLARRQAYWQEDFDETLLEITAQAVRYKGQVARHVVFCRGRADALSPYWSWLPFKHAKGEVLHVQFEGGAYSSIINKGCWIIPRSDGSYRVGSNYDWTDLSDQPTAQARQEITAKLQKLSKLPYSITAQQAGVRPTNTDRRPFIGSHPAYENMWIFNGLGTKGVSLSPYFAAQLIDHWLHQTPLEASVDVARHRRLYGGKLQ